MRSLAFVMLAALGVLAACSTTYPVVLTGRVAWGDSAPMNAWVRLYGPGLPPRPFRGKPPDYPTESSGRFHISRKFAAGCYTATILALESNHIVEWHFRVSGADSLEMGSATIWKNSMPSGEGVNHLFLDCGAQDTLQPRYSWGYDTVRVGQPDQ